jgi:negative regulator of flagellin synthesis FlgM
MKVNEIYTTTRLDQVGTSGSTTRLDQAGTAVASGDKILGQDTGSSQSDQVKLSNTSREMKQYLNIANQIPDVRLDKVQEIKRQLEEGTYHVDAQQLAGTIMSKGDLLNFVT